MLVSWTKSEASTLKPAVDLQPGQQGEVVAVQLPKLSQSFASSGSRQAQHSLGVSTNTVHGHGAPMN
jgi:hypothetical protein